MKITSIVENTSCCEEIGCEHGLSLLIETNQHKILFDMGQTDLFAENAEKLGIDLKDVDIAVLSHGHYDHGGGLKRFLELNRKAPVYLNRRAFEPHYNGTEKYIGLNTELQDSERLIFTGEEFHIDDGLTLYACNQKPKRFEINPDNLNVLKDGKFVAEDFCHEQYLVIEENGKRVLVSGCSHKGILNLTDWFQPDVLLGGFHFMKITDEKMLTDCARRLDSFPTEFYTFHCTGTDQFRLMEPHMQRLHYLSAGQTVTI